MKKILIIFLIPSLLAISGCFEEQEFSFPNEFSYVAFSNASIIVTEGEVPSIEVDIVYAGEPLSSALSVPVSIIPSGATDAQEGVDYTLNGDIGSLTIPAGQAKTSISINLINDEEAVGPRTLVFSIGEVSGHRTGKLGSDDGKTLALTILEDDLFVFGYTGFEEPAAGEVNNYPSQDGVEQVNVPGENSVDYVSVGGEMGFNMSYVPGQEGGADSGLLFGVTKFTSDDEWGYDIGSFAGGSQAYSTSDADGLAEIVFDELDIPEGTSFLSVQLQLYFIDASWEDDDEFDFFWRTEDGDELILSLRANAEGVMTDSADGSGNEIIDQWTQFNAPVSNIKKGALVIQIGTDSGSEINFLDEIYIRGI